MRSVKDRGLDAAPAGDSATPELGAATGDDDPHPTKLATIKKLRHAVKEIREKLMFVPKTEKQRGERLCASTPLRHSRYKEVHGGISYTKTYAAAIRGYFHVRLTLRHAVHHIY